MFKNNKNIFIFGLVILLFAGGVAMLLKQKPSHFEQSSLLNAQVKVQESTIDPLNSKAITKPSSHSNAVSSVAPLIGLQRHVASEPENFTSAKAKKLQKWLNTHYPSTNGWTVLSGSTGEVTFVRGGYIPCENLEQVSRSLQPMLDQLQIPSLQLDYKKQSVVGLEETMMIHIPQVMDGYELDDAKMVVSYDQVKKQIYSVSMDLRQTGSISQEVIQSKDSAVQIVKDRLIGKTIRSISVDDGPSIYNAAPGKSFLVWRVSVEISSPLLDSRQFFISAQDGEVVFEVSTLFH